MTTPLRRIAAFLLIFGALASGAWASQTETEQVDRTIPLQPGGSLRLKNFSGDIRITGTDAAEVIILAVRRAPRERLNRIKLTIESSGSEVVITANHREGRRDTDNVVETCFEIRVPRQISLNVTAFSSPITIENVEGQHEIHSFSGNVQLLKMAGPVRAKTFSGTIRLDSMTTNDLDVDTFSGDVVINLPQDARADIRFNSFSGDITSALPMILVSKSRRMLHATLNGGGNDVRVKTFSGDVRLR